MSSAGAPGSTAGPSGTRVRGLARAPKHLLHEARLLLVPLHELREGSNPERTMLSAAKGLNVLSQRDGGRAAMLATAGLLEAMVGVVAIWLEEEILPKQSMFHRQQALAASQERTGLAGRSRNSQSTWYSMEVLEALCRLTKNEDVCRLALSKLGFHGLLLRIMGATAAPIGVRSACAAGLRGMTSLGPCRIAMLAEQCVLKLVGLIESLQSKIESLQGHFEIEHTNLQLQSLEVLTCLLDADDGCEQVLQKGIRMLAKLLASSTQDIAKLAAAAAIALCLRASPSASHHMVCTTGPSTLVLTADVLLKAAEERKVKPTSAGALADVVKAIQRSSQVGAREEEARCKCGQCPMRDDKTMKEYSHNIAAMAAHFNITHRYLVVRGGLSFELGDEDADEWTNEDIATDRGSLSCGPGPGERASVTLAKSIGKDGLFGAYFKNNPGHRSHFLASKNGSCVVKRPSTSDGSRGRRSQNPENRRNEVLPPPWGPPPSVQEEDAAGIEAEAMRKLVASPNLDKIAGSMTFKSRGDRHAWQFLLGHVSTGAGGGEQWLVRQQKQMGGGDANQEKPWLDGDNANAREIMGTGKEESRVERSTRRPEGELDTIGNVPDIGHFGGPNAGAQHAPDCPLSPSGRLWQEVIKSQEQSGQGQCNCGLCPPFKAQIIQLRGLGQDGQSLSETIPQISSEMRVSDFNREGAGQMLATTNLRHGSPLPSKSCVLPSRNDASFPERKIESGLIPGEACGLNAFPAKEMSTAAEDGNWSESGPTRTEMSLIPTPLQPLLNPKFLMGSHAQEEWAATSPITSPPPPPAAGFPAPGQYNQSCTDRISFKESQATGTLEKPTSARILPPTRLPTPRRASSSGLPSFASKPSPRLIWSEAGDCDDSLRAEGCLITTHSVMPVCRNEVGMQRPSTGDQGNRKRERVFLKVRPSTGEWKNPKKPLEGSGRLQVAFADRPFVLDGWGKEWDGTTLASEERDLASFTRRGISLRTDVAVAQAALPSHRAMQATTHPEILSIDD